LNLAPIQRRLDAGESYSSDIIDLIAEVKRLRKANLREYDRGHQKGVRVGKAWLANNMKDRGVI
jgi:hypothetical protein